MFYLIFFAAVKSNQLYFSIQCYNDDCDAHSGIMLTMNNAKNKKKVERKLI